MLIPQREGRGGDGGGEYGVGVEDSVSFGIAERAREGGKVFVAASRRTRAGAAGEVGEDLTEMDGEAGRGYPGVVGEWAGAWRVFELELCDHLGGDGGDAVGVEHAEAARNLTLVDEFEGTRNSAVGKGVFVLAKAVSGTLALEPNFGSVVGPPLE